MHIVVRNHWYGNIVGVATALVAGGPFYYIENGMGKKCKWLGKIFAFFGVGVGLFGIGTFTQINGVAKPYCSNFIKWCSSNRDKKYLDKIS